MAPSCTGSGCSERGEEEEEWGGGGERGGQGLNEGGCGSLSVTAHPLASTLDEEAASTRGEAGLVMARQTQTSVPSALHKRYRCQIFRCL